MNPFVVNLVLAWLWILLGFLSGLVLGLFFHRENWLGGYSSLKRRLYRLGHISLFGLGVVNLLFYLTVDRSLPATSMLQIASWSFIIGAVSMPICCLIMAHFPKARLLFALPVLSLLAAGGATLAGIIISEMPTLKNPAPSAIITSYPAP
jgi:hypothetical protein